LVRLIGEAGGEQDETERRMGRAIAALAAAGREGLVGKLAIERIDGEPVLGSAFEQVLVGLGFSAGPRRLTLRASV
jgi:ATP-dependent Lhr-like helicase